MFISIIRPEGLVILAYGQWRDACRLNTELEKYFREQALPKDLEPKVNDVSVIKQAKEITKRRENWLGMNGAFFVDMDGFTIDASTCTSTENVGSESMRRLVKLSPRTKSKFTATLTPTGFVKYLKEGYFEFDNPPFQRSHITDKGKTSNIAKVLSASQAMWLLLQSGGRWAGRLKLKQGKNFCVSEIIVILTSFNHSSRETHPYPGSLHCSHFLLLVAQTSRRQ